VACCRAKLPRAAAARHLYRGLLFKQSQRAAVSLRPTHGYLILSARYGLVRPDTVLEPYNLLLGQPGSITRRQLREQAKELGVADHRRVVVLAPNKYSALARAVWPYAATPLAGTRGSGDQSVTLARIIMRGRLE
jgi:hypothetical protein